jgi:hypothetical protein
VVVLVMDRQCYTQANSFPKYKKNNLNREAKSGLCTVVCIPFNAVDKASQVPIGSQAHLVSSQVSTHHSTLSAFYYSRRRKLPSDQYSEELCADVHALNASKFLQVRNSPRPTSVSSAFAMSVPSAAHTNLCLKTSRQ